MVSLYRILASITESGLQVHRKFIWQAISMDGIKHNIPSHQMHSVIGSCFSQRMRMEHIKFSMAQKSKHMFSLPIISLFTEYQHGSKLHRKTRRPNLTMECSTIQNAMNLRHLDLISHVASKFMKCISAWLELNPVCTHSKSSPRMFYHEWLIWVTIQYRLWPSKNMPTMAVLDIMWPISLQWAVDLAHQMIWKNWLTQHINMVWWCWWI